ncbi:response regulator [bacterium]|nr:response regulator [bacterium]
MELLNRRVIIADDEATTRALMKRIVLSIGHRVVGEAVDGNEAASLYKTIKPDLLLLDIFMPGKNGDEVLRDIIGEFPDACVIIMTSTADSEMVKECIGLGAKNYILKTNTVIKMKDMIEETMKKNPAKHT